MSGVIYIGNDNDIVVSPVIRRLGRVTEIDVQFSCTLKDDQDSEISGAVDLLTAFDSTTGEVYVTIPGTVCATLTNGGKYFLYAVGTGAYENKVEVTAKPLVARYRQ